MQSCTLRLQRSCGAQTRIKSGATPPSRVTLSTAYLVFDVADDNSMTSNRPYLLRAMHEWISDNGLTPYLLVDASQPGVRVPAASIRDGRVVLNVALRAVANLDLGNERIRCMARFGGVSQAIDLPIDAVGAIYAHENGQGMMFPQEDGTAVAPEAAQSAPSLQSVPAVDEAPEAMPDAAPEAADEPPPKGPPRLRVVK